MADGYVPLSGFGIGPDGFSGQQSSYTGNHTLHGTLGNDPTDGFWWQMRNPQNVAPGVGSYFNPQAPSNGQWLPNGTRDASGNLIPPSNSSFAWHKPGDTHPSNRDWQVALGDELQDSFNQYAAEAQTKILADRPVGTTGPLTADETSRARAQAYQLVASRDAVAIQSFTKDGLANEYDPSHPDRPFWALHDGDPRLARARAAGGPGSLAELQGHWTWDRVK